MLTVHQTLTLRSCKAALKITSKFHHVNYLSIWLFILYLI